MVGKLLGNISANKRGWQDAFFFEQFSYFLLWKDGKDDFSSGRSDKRSWLPPPHWHRAAAMGRGPMRGRWWGSRMPFFAFTSPGLLGCGAEMLGTGLRIGAVDGDTRVESANFGPCGFSPWSDSIRHSAFSILQTNPIRYCWWYPMIFSYYIPIDWLKHSVGSRGLSKISYPQINRIAKTDQLWSFRWVPTLKNPCINRWRVSLSFMIDLPFTTPQRAPNSPEPWELAIFRGKIFSNPLGWTCWDMLRWSSRNCSRGPGPSFDLPAEQTPPRLPRKLLRIMTRSIGLVLDAMPSSSSWRLGDDLFPVSPYKSDVEWRWYWY